MTQYFSVDAASSTGAPERKREDRLAAFWFIFLAAIIAVGAIASDASLTQDQRIQAYQQSGMFP